MVVLQNRSPPKSLETPEAVWRLKKWLWPSTQEWNRRLRRRNTYVIINVMEFPGHGECVVFSEKFDISWNSRNSQKYTVAVNI